jgi:hypothetical protein
MVLGEIPNFWATEAAGSPPFTLAKISSLTSLAIIGLINNHLP